MCTYLVLAKVGVDAAKTFLGKSPRRPLGDHLEDLVCIQRVLRISATFDASHGIARISGAKKKNSIK